MRTLQAAAALLALISCSAFAIPAEAGSISCRVAGPTRLVDRNVFGGDAVVQVRADGALEVVIADDVEPCTHVAFAPDGTSEGMRLGSCPIRVPKGHAAARNEFESYEARSWLDASGVPHVRVGYLAYDFPHARFGVAREGRAHLIEHRFVAPPSDWDEGETDPALAALGPSDQGFLLVWVEGGEVRAQPLVQGAEPAGVAIDLAPEDATDIGRPSVAFTSGGRGLVAFTALTPDGDEAVAVPVSCSR